MKTASKTTGKVKSVSEEHGMEESKLMKLFEDQLKDIYWAEKAVAKAFPKFIKNATSDELIDTIENHLDETEAHAQKLEQVFETFDKKAVAKKCEAMAGLLKEAEDIIKSCDKGAMCDAGIIAAVQKIEHYEIATYGTLRTFAQELNLTEATSLLEEILNEEKQVDEKLTQIAKSTVNIQALEEVE